MKDDFRKRKRGRKPDYIMKQESYVSDFDKKFVEFLKRFVFQDHTNIVDMKIVCAAVGIQKSEV